MNTQNIPKLVVIISVLFCIASPFHIINTTAQTSPTDLTGKQIALYFGGSTSSESRTALQLMFSWMNASVDILDASDIVAGNLSDYDMIVIPGGWAGDYNVDLAGMGIIEIRNFIRDGGAFFGVCAGAYFGCDKLLWEGGFIEYPLNLFDGYGIGPVEEIATWPNRAMTDVILNHTSTIIDFSGEPTNHTIQYFGGPWFNISGKVGIHSLATYAANDESAMITFEYQDGRVFLSGPHPEWEEDSDRDNSVGWDAAFDDNGSEWDMMLKVSLWLLENSGSETTSPTTTSGSETTSPTTSSESATTQTSTSPEDPFNLDPMMVISVTSIGILVVALVLLKRR